VKLTKDAHFSTICLHAGQQPDPSTGAIVTPIYQTSTYVQDELGVHKGYEYARTQNPTRFALERNIAAIEGGVAGLAFASGMAAIGAIGTLLKAGDHVIVSKNTYGGTFRFFDKVLTRVAISFSYVDTANLDEIERAITPATRMLFVETPTNPVMRLTDLAGAADLAHRHHLRLAVDNTFASPYVHRPIAFGADLVVHSTTKYLNGHSDVVGGAILTSDEKLYGEMKFYQNAAGGVPSPFDSWLVLRGVKTLAVRMRQHCENAQAIAEHLDGHPLVRKVYYPGLPDHPDHVLAQKQMRGFGGMVSFAFEGTRADVDVFVRNLRVFQLAESLGGVESLCCHPATMTHGSIPKAERERRGVTETLLRLSVGIEDVSDLIADLDLALEAVSARHTQHKPAEREHAGVGRAAKRR
jgi:cystathionine beta-lyase/cystathionine gamma-synthase